MSPSTSSVLIVGAGMFGATASVELRRRGYAVTLVDPGPLPRPQAASCDISRAVRVDYGDDLFYTELAERALERWRDWNTRLDRPIFHETGFLLAAGEPMRPGGFEHDSYRLLTARGYQLERLDAARLRARYPAFSGREYADGYYNPIGGWIESARVVELCLREAEALGVTARPGVAVRELIERGGAVVGARAADGSVLEADLVVLAAGAWTPALAPWLAGSLRAVAQPVLYLAPARAERYRGARFPLWGADIARTGWYGFPATDAGIVKVGHHGPGRELSADVDRTLSDEDERGFREFLRESLPGLGEAARADGKLCFYCDTIDGDFLIDRDPGHPGLFVATGGSGHAMKFAPIMGAIVADIIEGQSEIRRFAWRSHGNTGGERSRAR